ncbi:MAG: hypothetical protein QOF50_297, partial [Gaiellaceae bacterium]|nr:hypothetical protein [Gaiellaceae bacterium]
SSLGRARVRASRRWASPSAKRPTTIVIVLRAAGIVELRVNQISPLCRNAGRILVYGHAGRNVIRFRGRVGGRALAPGTYRITPRLRSGRQLRTLLVVVVVGRSPAPGEVASGRAANACAGGREATGAESGSTAAISRTVAAHPTQRKTKLALGAPARAHAPRRGGVLGADFAQTLRDPTSVSPVLLILLAIAICLLGLAALPRSVVASPVLAEQLTHRRLELALAGTTTLLVVVLAYMIF